MTDEEMSDAFFDKLGGDLLERDAWKNNQRPLLAHYTSIHTLERVLKTEEVWFSNPLFMNDIEEMRFGFNTARDEFLLSEAVRKGCETDERTDRVQQTYLHYFSKFEDVHALDVYVFCLSEHEKDDTDGRLSMWRAYAKNGNGAAIVFDTGALEYINGSPLAVAKVEYLTVEDRKQWIRKKIDEWALLVQQCKIETDRLYLPVYYLFHILSIYALTTKHRGFAEEQEWRIVYTPDRDDSKLLASRFSHIVTDRGIEPKLKLPIAPIKGVTGDNLSLRAITDRVILGPSMSSPLARNALIQMLQREGKNWLINKIYSSSIPFRPTQ